jgi:hypothetical protein
MTLRIGLAVVVAVGSCRSDAEKVAQPRGGAPSDAGIASEPLSSAGLIATSSDADAAAGAPDVAAPSQASGMSARGGDAPDPATAGRDAGGRSERPSAETTAPGQKVVYHALYAVPVDQAEAVFRNRLLPAARSCYYTAQRQDDRDAGKLGLLLRVTSAGSIQDVHVRWRSVSSYLAECVASAARKLSFHPLADAIGSWISIEFLFSTPQHPIRETFSPEPQPSPFPGKVMPI